MNHKFQLSREHKRSVQPNPCVTLIRDGEGQTARTRPSRERSELTFQFHTLSSSNQTGMGNVHTSGPNEALVISGQLVSPLQSSRCWAEARSEVQVGAGVRRGAV